MGLFLDVFILNVLSNDVNVVGDTMYHIPCGVSDVGVVQCLGV